MLDVARTAHEAGTVRKARPDEHERLAAVLARALFDDPVMRWIIGDDGRRRSVLETKLRPVPAQDLVKQDECYTTESAVGAAVWELPGQWKIGILDQLRLLPSMARINGRLLPRALRTIATLESNHPAAPHYYLPFVGVEPEWQGRGLGTALMRPVLDRCDEEKMPAYLEASSPRNRVLYERHGFQVTEQFSLGPDSPPLWRMWRNSGG